MHVELGRELAELVADPVEHRLVVVDEVHLVDTQHEVGDTEQRGEERMTSGLLDDAVAGIDEHQREVGGRSAGDHVAGVLDVAGSVGDDELAGRRREVAIGHVDGDALFPLGAQSVGEQREVRAFFAPQTRGVLDRFERVLEDLLRVVQQPTDERALAVVDRPRGGEPQQFHQK